MPPDPEDLVQRAALRDVEAFARLYDEHLNTVYRFVLFKVGDATLAEDLTAEVFSKAWESIDRFQWRNLPFQHWLIKIARNVVVDHWRANKRPIGSIDGLFDAASSDAPPDERVAANLEVEELRTALARLPDDQRDTLMSGPRVAIMRLVVVTPEQFLGDVVGNLEARGGRIKKIAPVGELEGLLALVPMAELSHYPDDLAHITGGQARYQISFSHYQTDGDDPDAGAGVQSPLKPSPPVHSGKMAARPPLDAWDLID